jgi:hypothetical protein
MERLVGRVCVLTASSSACWRSEAIAVARSGLSARSTLAGSAACEVTPVVWTL